LITTPLEWGITDHLNSQNIASPKLKDAGVFQRQLLDERLENHMRKDVLVVEIEVKVSKCK